MLLLVTVCFILLPTCKEESVSILRRLAEEIMENVNFQNLKTLKIMFLSHCKVLVCVG